MDKTEMMALASLADETARDHDQSGHVSPVGFVLRKCAAALRLAALRLAAESSAGAVKVSHLDWGEPYLNEIKETAVSAHSWCGRYIASDHGWFLCGLTQWNEAANIDAAKAAAQADYEARILSALTSEPVKAGDAALLREALKKIARLDGLGLYDGDIVKARYFESDVRLAREALSTAQPDTAAQGGKQSDGGSRKQPFDPADAAGVKSGTVTFDGQTGRPNRDKVGASQTPGSSMSFAANKPITAGQAPGPSDTAPAEPVARVVPLKNLAAMLALLPPKPVTTDDGTFVYQDPNAAERLYELRSVFDAMIAVSPLYAHPPRSVDVEAIKRAVVAWADAEELELTIRQVHALARSIAAMIEGE
jgi:hypothetical protein